jgi:uncharacterized protein YbaR (Trm112 family)
MDAEYVERKSRSSVLEQLGGHRSFSLESTCMPVDPELLEILACPNCKTKVDLVKDGTALKCGQCKRVYPIKDDIPVMLIDEATIEP